MLTLSLPISPMLAKASDTIPVGDYAYEPKWDGFRCLIVRDETRTSLLSRSGKPLDRYFPDVIELASSLPPTCVLDGELVVRCGAPGAQRLSWDDLSARVHPAASRVARLAQETPAEVVLFDALALGPRDLTPLPYRERRAALETLFAEHATDPRVHLSAMTTDPDVAADWFVRFEGAGLDGVIAKPLDAQYEQGKRSMLKIKHKRTAEAVVIGYRLHKDGAGVGALMLGLYDGQGELRGVGGIGAFTAARRRELIDELAPLVIADDASAVPVERQKSRFAKPGTDAVALKPERVVEVAFDQLEGQRFRHAVTFLRWRPDRDPASCLISQVDRAIGYDLDEVFLT